jgi:hypothetical protein
LVESLAKEELVEDVFGHVALELGAALVQKGLCGDGEQVAQSSKGHGKRKWDQNEM